MIIAEYKCLLPPISPSTNYVKSYGFVEQRNGSYRNGFTVIWKLGNARYAIGHDFGQDNKKLHVTNLDDMGIYITNFLRLNGY